MHLKFDWLQLKELTNKKNHKRVGPGVKHFSFKRLGVADLPELSVAYTATI